MKLTLLFTLMIGLSLTPLLYYHQEDPQVGPTWTPTPATNDNYWIFLATNQNDFGYFTNAPAFSAEDLVFKARSNGQLTNLVNELVKSGEFCQVRGHVWHYGDKPEDNYYGLTFENAWKNARKCAVCGIVQVRSTATWHKP